MQITEENEPMRSLKGVKVAIGPSTFAALDSGPMNRLVEQGCTVIDNHFKRKLTKDELLRLLGDDVIGLVAGLESLDREVMEKTNLKVISRCGSGMSNVDMQAADELGIKVRSTPFGPTKAVAEITLGVMLSLLRMVPHMNKDLHDGKWAKKIGLQLTGKTVAIIGFGRIGHCLSKFLEPFKTRILAVDPYLDEPIEGASLVPLRKALPQSDIISFHSAGESCIMGTDEFALVKPGAFILNAARGGLVDESALIKALDNRVVAGAWLDTFEKEPYEGPLTKYPQVILTPHIGSYTLECRKEMEMEAVENLIAALMEESI
jgi:D-3-phosphoglycerate dehydrogenase / 2-oxoglutarate reductase